MTRHYFVCYVVPRAHISVRPSSPSVCASVRTTIEISGKDRLCRPGNETVGVLAETAAKGDGRRGDSRASRRTDGSWPSDKNAQNERIVCQLPRAGGAHRITRPGGPEAKSENFVSMACAKRTGSHATAQTHKKHK